MSKILINFEVLKRVIEALDYGYENLADNGCIFANDLDLAMHDLKKAIEESNSKRLSVLEWHPISEKPKDESDILVREKDGCVFDTHAFDSVDDGDWEIVRGNKNQIVEWAYPPERKP